MRDVPGDYQESEIGDIPNEWRTVELGTLGLRFHGGGTPSTKIADYWGGPIPWTTSSYIDTQLYLNRCAGYITEKGLNNSSSQLVPKGNLLVGTRVGVGRVAINTMDTAISQDLTAIIVDDSQTYSEFLAYAIRSSPIQQRMLSASRGTTIKGIPRADLIKIPISLPPLPEQRRIAAVLNAIQDAIAAQEDVIAAAKTFKRSLMHRLFTYGAGRETVETKETEIGEIPAHWEVATLGSLLTDGITNGAFVKREQFGHGVPFLNVADMYSSVEANLELCERVTVDETAISKYTLKPGDLVFVRSSLKEEGVGQCCVIGDVNERSIYDCHLMRVRVDQGQTVSRFLAYFFLTPLGKNSLISRSKKTTMTTINQKGLADSVVPIPDFVTQHTVAELIQSIDAKIGVEEDCLTALQALFKSMLHQLMTGQIRLLSDEGLPLA